MSSPEHRLVAFAPYGRRAGSSRVRVFEWIDHLGLEAAVHVFTEENAAGLREVVRQPVRSLRRHRKLTATKIAFDDIVLIHRELSPFSDGRAEERILRAGARGIVDLDDGLQWDWGQGGYARRFQPKSPKIRRMVRAADVVIAGNDLIAEWASQYANRVVVIPSCVEPSRYRMKSDYALSKPPIIGWIGSVSTERFLEGWREQLTKAHVETGAQLRVIGVSSTAFAELNEMTDRRPWTEEIAFAQPACWDVGIMPLPDGLLERGKCGYKLLQYGAAGLPSLADPVGVNAELLEHGDLTLAQMPSLLEATPALRRALGESLHKRVTAHYSFEANATLFVDALGFGA